MSLSRYIIIHSITTPATLAIASCPTAFSPKLLVNPALCTTCGCTAPTLNPAPLILCVYSQSSDLATPTTLASSIPNLSHVCHSINQLSPPTVEPSRFSPCRYGETGAGGI